MAGYIFYIDIGSRSGVLHQIRNSKNRIHIQAFTLSFSTFSFSKRGVEEIYFTQMELLRCFGTDLPTVKYGTL